MKRPKIQLRGGVNALELYARLYAEAQADPNLEKEERRLKAPPDFRTRIQKLLGISSSDARAWERECLSRNGWMQRIWHSGDTILLKHPSHLTEGLRSATKTPTQATNPTLAQTDPAPKRDLKKSVHQRGGIDFGIGGKIETDPLTPLLEEAARTQVFVSLPRVNPIAQLPKQPIRIKEKPVMDEPVTLQSQMVEPIVQEATDVQPGGGSEPPMRQEVWPREFPPQIISLPSHSEAYATLMRQSKTVRRRGRWKGWQTIELPINRLKKRFSEVPTEQLQGLLNELCEGGFIHWVNFTKNSKSTLGLIFLKPPPINWVPPPDLNKTE